MGLSAGGLVAYKVGLRASTTMFVETCNPLIIKGLILHSPSFDGQNRTRSEVHHVNDRRVPSTVFDFFARKSLPIEAERGHDYWNIREGLEDGVLDRVRELGWRVLLKGGSKDPFVDRQIELIKLLGENGVIVISDFTPGDFHVQEYTHAQKFDRFLVIIRDFISSCMSSTNGHPNPKTLKPNL